MGRSYYGIRVGDLVTLRDEISIANIYRDSSPFRFGDVLTTLVPGVLGIVLSRISENNLSILYHHVRILFTDGRVGVVITENLRVIQGK